jgi:small-conductance mechanosensitive channel
VRSLIAILWGLAWCVVGMASAATLADASPIADSAPDVRAVELERSRDAEGDEPVPGLTELAEPTAASAAPPSPSPPSANSSSPTSPSPSPSPSASGAALFPPSESAVRVRDRTVFVIRDAQSPKNAAARAQAATQALERLLDEHDAPSIRVEERGDVAVVFGGTVPILQLRPADAAAAGDATLSIHAASVAARIDEALRSERQRKAIVDTVFAVSLFVFSALIAVLLLRKVRELAGKTRAWVESHPERFPALRIHGIDLLRATAVRGALLVALSLGRLLSQLGIAYGWILFASSLFDATRTYTERLTGFVLTPLSALIGRVGSALPLLVIATAALLATVLLVRFVGLFFGSVARGETTVGWLPSDLAVPTGALVRLGIVIAALLLAAPLVTGNDDGALARAGVAALLAVGLASAPVLASVGAGVPAVYGRKVRVGNYAEVGGRVGRVLAVNLLEVRLEDADGCLVRVPHLMTLVHPTRVLGSSPVATLDVVVDPGASQAQVRSLLLAVTRRFGAPARVELMRLDASGAHYRVVARASSALDVDLATAVAEALERDGIALGRTGPERA